MKQDAPKRGVWILLAVTSLLAILAVLTRDDFIRMVANAIFFVSAVWATFYFVRQKKLAMTIVVLAIFGVVVFVAGRPTPVPPNPELQAILSTTAPPPTPVPAPVTSTVPQMPPVMPEPPIEPMTQSAPPPVSQTVAQTATKAPDQKGSAKSLVSVTDAYLQTLQVQPIPYDPSKEPKAPSDPVVVQKTQPVAREWFYADETRALYHAEGCPDITPGMNRAVKTAMTLRGFRPHTCVK